MYANRKTAVYEIKNQYSRRHSLKSADIRCMYQNLNGGTSVYMINGDFNQYERKKKSPHMVCENSITQKGKSSFCAKKGPNKVLNL